eukprot:5241315-Amphidinium_carterae.1
MGSGKINFAGILGLHPASYDVLLGNHFNLLTAGSPRPKLSHCNSIAPFSNTLALCVCMRLQSVLEGGFENSV